MEPSREDLLAAVCPPQREVFCSALLRWCLLNFDDFRVAFLKKASSGHCCGNFQAKGETVDVMKEVEFGGEGDDGRWDLLIEASRAERRWFMVVEVKVSAPFADGQLKKYRRAAEQKMKEGGFADALLVTLTRGSERPEGANGHLSWGDVVNLLKEKAPDGVLKREILAFLEAKVLPMQLDQLNTTVLSHCSSVRRLVTQLRAVLEELRSRPPFNSIFARQQVTEDDEKPPSDAVWIGLYKWMPEGRIIDLYVGFKIESRNAKMSVFIQRQYGAGREQPQQGLGNGKWIKEAKEGDARCGVHQLEDAQGKELDGDPERIISWFQSRLGELPS